MAATGIGLSWSSKLTSPSTRSSKIIKSAAMPFSFDQKTIPYFTLQNPEYVFNKPKENVSFFTRRKESRGLRTTQWKAYCTTRSSVRPVTEMSASELTELGEPNCEEGTTEIDYDWNDQDQQDLIGDDDDEEGSPWEGAIVYKRNPSVSHMEFCTSLERLGLGKLSTEISRTRASVMGLRVTKPLNNDCANVTPVLVSVDITRKKHKLRLDGIIRTVITLGCNRCGEPAAESIFSNFALLLSEEPIEEQEIINMGTIFGEDKFRTFGNSIAEEEDEDSCIDIDDQLYFPPEEKFIDISKHIRDLVHVEITINALCDPMCKGLCLRCGTNLNVNSCSCEVQEVEKKRYGPLGSLREQMQQK